MERKTELAAIKWQNEKKGCKVAIAITSNDESTVYLLLRKKRWDVSNVIYEIPENDVYACTVEEARTFWKTLTEKHDFEWLSHES